MKRVFALCFSLWLLLLPVLAAEADSLDTPEAPETSSSDDFGDSTENDAAAPPTEDSDFVELPNETVENPEIVENPIPDGVPGILDTSGPIPVIIVTPQDPPDDDSDSELDGDTEEEPPPDAPLDGEDELLEPPAVTVPAEEGFPMVYAAGHALDLDIDDMPPASPLFYGAVYVTGYDSRLGNVTVYFPANYQSGVLGLDSSGYLVSVYSSSVTGYLAGVNNNRVNVSTWSRPTYSQYSGSSSTTYTLNLKPVSSNADLMTSSLPRMSFQQLYPYLMILFLGVILVCCMKR